MAFKFVAFFALVASATSAVPIGFESRPTYSDATTVSFSSVSSPVDHPHGAAPAHQAPLYAAPAHSDPTAVKVAAPVYKLAPTHHDAQEYAAPAHYVFAYSVDDAHTGDVHGQQESREGDVVKGSYYLVEADGSRRVVDYTVDAHSGFDAVVRKEAGVEHHGNVAAHHQVAYAAPRATAHHAYAPPALGAPFAGKAAYSAAPVVSYSSVSAPVDHAAASSYYH